MAARIAGADSSLDGRGIVNSMKLMSRPRVIGPVRKYRTFCTGVMLTTTLFS
jgi:hypothetical protein